MIPIMPCTSYFIQYCLQYRHVFWWSPSCHVHHTSFSITYSTAMYSDDSHHAMYVILHSVLLTVPSCILMIPIMPCTSYFIQYCLQYRHVFWWFPSCRVQHPSTGIAYSTVLFSDGSVSDTKKWNSCVGILYLVVLIWTVRGLMLQNLKTQYVFCKFFY
jgi:hypothetical protein